MDFYGFIVAVSLQDAFKNDEAWEVMQPIRHFCGGGTCCNKAISTMLKNYILVTLVSTQRILGVFMAYFHA